MKMYVRNVILMNVMVHCQSTFWSVSIQVGLGLVVFLALHIHDPGPRSQASMGDDCGNEVFSVASEHNAY